MTLLRSHTKTSFLVLKIFNGHENITLVHKIFTVNYAPFIKCPPQLNTIKNLNTKWINKPQVLYCPITRITNIIYQIVNHFVKDNPLMITDNLSEDSPFKDPIFQTSGVAKFMISKKGPIPFWYRPWFITNLLFYSYH